MDAAAGPAALEEAAEEPAAARDRPAAVLEEEEEEEEEEGPTAAAYGAREVATPLLRLRMFMEGGFSLRCTRRERPSSFSKIVSRMWLCKGKEKGSR